MSTPPWCTVTPVTAATSTSSAPIAPPAPVGPARKARSLMPPVIAPAAVPPSLAQAPLAVVQRVAAAPHGWTAYTVRSGDNLSAIADRTGATVGALVARNHLRDGGSRLAVGQRLSVPKTAAQARAEAARAKAAATAR